MKKRILTTLLVCALVCGAAACDGGNKPAATTTAAAQTTAAATTEAKPAVTATAEEITSAVLAEIPISSAFAKDKDSLEDYFDGMDTSKVQDFSYYICASGAYPDEIAVFKFGSSDDAAAAVAAVNDRLEYQKKTYKDYTPDEYYKLEGAIVTQSGEWLYYIVTSDNQKANGIIKGFLG